MSRNTNLLLFERKCEDGELKGCLAIGWVGISLSCRPDGQYFSSRRSVARVTVPAHTSPIGLCALDTARIANSRDSRSTRFLFMAFPRHKVYEMAKLRSSS